MKNLLKYAAVGLAFGLAFLSGPTPVVDAQGVSFRGVQVKTFQALTAADNITAVHTVPAIYVKYVGDAALTTTATVAVAASGDATFQVNGVNDTTINVLANCGAAVGVLDLSTPAATCDTLGEALNAINESVNWVAVLGSALAADTSDNALKDVAATNAATPFGLALNQETTTGLTITVNPIVNRSTGILNWVQTKTGSGAGKLNKNPFEDYNTTLLYASENITTTDGAGNLTKVFCVVENYSQKAKYTEVSTLIYQEAAALTTVTGKIDEFINAGGLVCNGGKLLVRVNGTTTLTAPTVLATGFTSPVNP